MYKVLLVDDEILVREAIGKKIEWNRLGFELAGDCENGKAAMEFVQKQPVDVVLTDICMPYMDGMELSKFLHENYPQTAIIIFSGYSDFEYAKQAIQYKVSEYILKPVTAKELTDVLARIKKKLDDEHRQEEKMDELTKAYHSYTKNESLIISRALSRLVRGTQEVEISLRELREYGIVLPSAYFRVAAIDVDIYSDYYVATDELKKESALMTFVVENISSELVERDNVGLAYRDSDNRVCLLLWSKRPKDFNQEVYRICEEIQEAVYESMKLTVSVGIGIYEDDLEELSKSWEAAANILKYRYTKGTGMIFDCEKPKDRGDTVQLEEYFKTLAAAMKSNEKAVAEQTICDVEQWMSQIDISKNKVVAYLHQILRTVYEAANPINEKFLLEDSVISAVADAGNLKEAMKIVRAYVKKGLESMTATAQSSGERQAMAAMEYIKDNFDNPDLGLNHICDYLNISTSRFSTVFKEYTGKTFTEVLTNVRMERAKELLRQTSLKNYEIAEKVGFSDPHYFSITFKKMTGMTAKEYVRENQ